MSALIFEERLLADFNAVAECARERMLAAYGHARWRPWPERVRAAVAALLAFLDEDPGAAEILFGRASRDCPLLAQRRAHLLERLGLYVHAGGWDAEGSRKFEGHSADAMIGVSCSVVETHLLREGQDPLVTLTGTIAGLLIGTYLGPHAALAQMEDEGEGPAGGAVTGNAGEARGNAAASVPARVAVSSATWAGDAAGQAAGGGEPRRGSSSEHAGQASTNTRSFGAASPRSHTLGTISEQPTLTATWKYACGPVNRVWGSLPIPVGGVTVRPTGTGGGVERRRAHPGRRASRASSLPLGCGEQP